MTDRNAIAARGRRPMSDWQSSRMMDDGMLRGGNQPLQPHGAGDSPPMPIRGQDGTMYGPGYAADPTGGTDSSPAGRSYENEWLDNIIKLHDAGMLHPKVIEMLGPAIEAVQKSQDRRGKRLEF